MPRRSDHQVFAVTYPAFMQTLADMRAYRVRELAKLRALDASAQRDRARKLLRCPRLALVRAYDAIRRVQHLHSATPDTIRELADRCNPFAPSHEHVHRHVIPSGNRHRIVQNFGPLKRMTQMVVADVVAALHPPRQDQFLYHGGMPVALAAIEAAFREGYTHAVEVDLIDFYGSVRLTGLAELLSPLPRSVVEHVVWDNTSRRVASDDYAVPREEGHPSLSALVGLSLGAVTSPIVGERIIRHLLDEAQPGKVVTYADNILVLGRGEEEVVARAEHLRDTAARLPANALRSRVGRPAGFRDRTGGVEFSKQRGVAIRHRLNWVPGYDKQAEHEVAEITSRLPLAEIETAERKLVQWRRSYPFWRTGDAWVAHRLAGLAAIRYYQAAEPEHLTAAMDALVIAYIKGGQRDDLRDFLPAGSSARHERRRHTLYDSTRRLLASLAATT